MPTNTDPDRRKTEAERVRALRHTKFLLGVILALLISIGGVVIWPMLL
jgi:hypothetical protein